MASTDIRITGFGIEPNDLHLRGDSISQERMLLFDETRNQYWNGSDWTDSWAWFDSALFTDDLQAGEYSNISGFGIVAGRG